MRARLPRVRLLSPRFIVGAFIIIGIGIYYYSNSLSVYKINEHRASRSDSNYITVANDLFHEAQHSKILAEKPDKCMAIEESVADIDTVKIYPTFDFQPSWVRTKEFWDKSFEERYEKVRNESRRPKLKVIVVPHSHNDPGWLKTFEQYFEWKTKHIINNIVKKLHQYPNMTFIWTEISFLNAWWERSHPVKQKLFKKLIKEGRLEITTGGWVMPDEACTHLYSLIDQYIEGHQWIKTNLGIAPKIGWSIDPFGHGATVPYLLEKSGLEGAVIQRIHYAWKQWLAQSQIEEFYWIQNWSNKKPSLIVHNQPFDIYSIKSSCGPHPSVCLSFDFRRIPGEYSEYTAKHEEITDHNLHIKSKTLVEEYERIGSLTTHNVVLVPLGDDFRYEHSTEFDEQFTNYMKMFNYINSHNDLFNAEVVFGTPLDYFNAMKERHSNVPTLRGDFFVYSDIFSEGKPAYWSGYYTTRPYLKILAREFEHQLRTSEILFTLVSNRIKQVNTETLTSSERRLEKFYEQLINARRNLGLFQHHDAITGTSKANVMYDYGTKLFTSLYHCVRLQESALTTMLIDDSSLHSQNILQSETEWETYGKPVRKLQVSFVDRKKVVLFNSLAQFRTEVITVKSNTTDIRVLDTYRNEYVPYQISPTLDVSADGKLVISSTIFDVLFIARLPALTAITYNLEEFKNKSKHCSIFCNDCGKEQTDRSERNNFAIKKMMPGDIQLENSMLKLLINRNTGFLRQIFRKDIKKKNTVDVMFGAYQSAQRHSGAYLFMPDYESPEKQVLNLYASDSNTQDDKMVITSGPLSTEITTVYGPFLKHVIRIYNVDDAELSRAILIENLVDFESPPKNRETELFMRIQTDIDNGEPPVLYTDQNGFQYQKRVKVEKLGIEANYYPITTMAWIQDEQSRLTLITNHAQGASSFEPGRLEVMLDRRTLYDDFRGIGEGVVDNKPTVFQNWLLLEAMSDSKSEGREKVEYTNERRFNVKPKDALYQLPSPAAEYLSRTLNYPVNVYMLDTSEVGEINVKSHQTFVENFPSGVHLMSLRTITDDMLEQFPSKSCYMILHRPGHSCEIGDKSQKRYYRFNSSTTFSNLNVKNITAVSLTGLQTFKNISTFKDIKIEAMEIKTYKINF